MNPSKRILAVIGTRPEAIKMAPVINELRLSGKFGVSLCMTGQHREMADNILSVFSLVPDFDLEVMLPAQEPLQVATRVMEKLPPVIEHVRPDLLIVHGDTVTSFAAALAGFYRRIPIAHVEAGLRTGNLKSPWPEEAHRQLVDRISDLCFAPVDSARSALVAEGIAPEKIFVTGNTAVDALLRMKARLDHEPTLFESALDSMESSGYPVRESLRNERRIVLATAHRRENIGAPLENICRALRDVARSETGCDIVYPLHPNPRIGATARAILDGTPNIYLISPLDYAPFVCLMTLSHAIATDSGGIQEEAPSLGKPVLVLRDTTERPEAVDAATARVVGTDAGRITGELKRLLSDTGGYNAMVAVRNPFGDGRASVRIREHLERLLCGFPHNME